MSAIDDVVRANAGYADGFAGAQDGKPRKRLAVLTCMDARLDPLAAFGLDLGDAHVIRNAGGLPTDDALRSLAISQRVLGTTEVAVVHHTRCGMEGFDDDRFRHEVSRESGQQPSWRVAGFADVGIDTRRCMDVVRMCRWLPHRDEVRGFVYDVDTAVLSEIS